METNTNPYFVSAALVASELHKAMVVARDITITASNARALALRAGSGAAGFRALTDFIDELARKTVKTSIDINALAIKISRVASESARAESAMARFDLAVKKAGDASYVNSIAPFRKRVEQDYNTMREQFSVLVWRLKNELEELARELRTAIVLSTMSRVEATQAGSEFHDTLNTIAKNVAEAAEKIQHHVTVSQRYFSQVH